MKISIVVPAFNEEKLIEATLVGIGKAIEAFRARGWETEVVICDNNSTDRTAELGRAAGAIVVFEPVNQIGRARNTGAAAATGDWLVFIDADSIPSVELMEDVGEAIAGGNCLAGGATLRLGHGNRAAHLLTRFWNRVSRVGRLMAGSFIFCEAEAFREVGGFDQEYYCGEEIDLSQRLKRLAKKRRKKILILHRHPLQTSGRKVDLYGVGEAVRFGLRMLFTAGRAKKDKASCFIWYDGRR